MMPKNIFKSDFVQSSLFFSFILLSLSITLHFTVKKTFVTLFIISFIFERIYETFFTTKKLPGKKKIEEDIYLKLVIRSYILMVLAAIIEFYFSNKPLVMSLFILGSTLIITSLSLRLSSIFSNPSSWSFSTFSNPRKVNRNGIYKTIRHPYYLGVILEVTGFSIALNSWVSLAFGCLAVVPFEIYRGFKEELDLEEKFGWDYNKYRMEVNSYFPTIPSRKIFERRKKLIEVSPNLRKKTERRNVLTTFSGKNKRRFMETR